MWQACRWIPGLAVHTRCLFHAHTSVYWLSLALSFPLSHPHWTLAFPWCSPSSLLLAILSHERTSEISLCYNYLTLSARGHWLWATRLSLHLHRACMPAGLSPCSHSAHNCRADGHWHIDLRAGKHRNEKGKKKAFFSHSACTTTLHTYPAHTNRAWQIIKDGWNKHEDISSSARLRPLSLCLSLVASFFCPPLSSSLHISLLLPCSS